jgi:Ca-activated chloride channel homolog
MCWRSIAGVIAILCPLLTLAQAPSLPELRVDVNLVLLWATVTDGAHHDVPNLVKKDFRVWEDKIEQHVEYFSAERVPVSVGIIFDASRSMRYELTAARQAAARLLESGNPNNEYFLVQFNDSPRLIQDFTNEVATMKQLLSAAEANGNTSLYDAVYLGLEKVTRGRHSRKVLVLITDGEDNNSRYSLSAVRQFAAERDVTIYAIGLVNRGEWHFPGFSPQSKLKKLSEITGGTAFFPDTAKDLDDIFVRIGIDLKNQYVLGYRSLNLSRDGKWRKIRVEIDKPKDLTSLHVLAKKGYYAATIPKGIQ